MAYYPPYHSQYNAIERTFGWLEQHWSGALLDSLDTVMQFAKTLNFKGRNPIVKWVRQPYQCGVKLSQKAMAKLETQFQRLPGLEKWFVEIASQSHENG